MLILFSVTVLGVNTLNQFNLRDIYERHYTERALLSNSLIDAVLIEKIKLYVPPGCAPGTQADGS